MITKAIVEEVLTPYSVRVRIPLLDGIEDSKYGTANKDLSIATVCALPNTTNLVIEGDIVFVSFEDNDLGKPVIIGALLKETGNLSSSDVSLRHVDVSGVSTLSYHTTIGKVQPNELDALCGVRDNLQKQIDDLQKQITDLKNELAGLKGE